MLPFSGEVGSRMAFATVSNPLRREMPPVAWTSKLVSSVQERGNTSISERSAMAGVISPPLNAKRFMICI